MSAQPMELLEESLQQVPRIEPGSAGINFSRPLWELESAAPKLPERNPQETSPGFAFANDEAASYYESTLPRTQTQDYQHAGNRVALIVGEGYLAAALKYIPEETIIMLDCQLSMVRYMSKYIEHLRRWDTPDEWKTEMLHDYSELAPLVFDPAKSFNSLLNRVASHWQAAGLRHPLHFIEPKDPVEEAVRQQLAYEEARDLAKRKAIITWRANLAVEDQMRHLAETLSGMDATVTFANLTNTLVFDRDFETSNQIVRNMKLLPTSQFCPILTTSDLMPINKFAFKDDAFPKFATCPATGPFFGVDNLPDDFIIRENAAAVRQQYPIYFKDEKIFQRYMASQVGGNLQLA